MTQPEEFYEVANDHAIAISRKDAAYEELRQVDSVLNLRIRKEREDNKEKTTEAIISAEVQAHQEHIEAYDEFLYQKSEADRLSALKDAMQQRAHMLRELVQLYVTGYYSNTALGTDTAEVRQFKGDSTKERVKKGRKRLAEES